MWLYMLSLGDCLMASNDAEQGKKKLEPSAFGTGLTLGAVTGHESEFPASPVYYFHSNSSFSDGIYILNISLFR